MKYLSCFLFVLIISSCNQQTISYKEISLRTEKSQELLKKFGKSLKGKLQNAMKSGGPLNAIKVCNEQAPLIAQKLSEESGWDIYRTSLKPRVREPDDWEKRMMLSFEQRHDDGDTFKSLFNQDIVEVNGKPSFRYIQAIETKEVCQICHGENVDDAIVEAIQQLYPNDKAVGFKVGDIRGAFSIVQPLN